MSFHQVFLCHFALCSFLTGMIWVIQRVHYPAFRFVDSSQFPNFHAHHSGAITWIVGPFMALEMLTAIFLYRMNEDIWWLANLGLVLFLWLLTALVSVPIHHQLAKGKSDSLISRLVATNWPRTVIWTGRSIALLWLLLAQGA